MAPLEAGTLVVDEPLPSDPAGTRRLGLRASPWPAEGSPSSRPSVVSVDPRLTAGRHPHARRRWAFVAVGIALSIALAVSFAPRRQPPVVWATPVGQPPPPAAGTQVERVAGPTAADRPTAADPTVVPASSVDVPAATPPAQAETPAPSSHGAIKSTATRPVDPPSRRDSCSPP